MCVLVLQLVFFDMKFYENLRIFQDDLLITFILLIFITGLIAEFRYYFKSDIQQLILKQLYTHVEIYIYNLYFKKMKILTIFLCIMIAAWAQDGQDLYPQDKTLFVEVPKEVVMSVGQIMPGQIDKKVSDQKIFYIKTDKLQKKFLFIRVSSFDKVRHSIGLYSNATRNIVHGCQDSMFDSCYVPKTALNQNEVYVILVIGMENMKFNLYTYWADLQHLKPNQQMKFTFNKQDLTQLFHLELQGLKYQQVRITLRPQTGRVQGDSVKMFANIGFDQEPTFEKHDIISSHVWNDAQAIFISREQVKDAKGIGLYIVGDSDTIYVMDCQLVESLHHQLEINETINQFLPKNKQTFYKISLLQNQGIDIYTLKFSAFTGEVSVNFYYDKELTKQFSKQPFQYMSDMQFYFSKSDFDGDVKQIYMKVKSYDSKATYQVLLQGRRKQLAYEISENVYQFSVLKQKNKAIGMYFYAHIWSQPGDYEQLQNYKYDLSYIPIFGKTTFEYYVCKPNSTQANCKVFNESTFQQEVEKIQPVGIQQIGTKIIATLELNVSKFKQINNLEKKALIMIIIRNPSDEKAALAVQYSNPNNIRLLRQGRAFEDKVRSLQRKYYKYVNNNPKITELRFHINEVSGLTKVRAKRQNIRQPGGNQIKLDPNQPNTIVIKDDITKPVYIEVFGLVSSIYTISLSADHAQHGVSSALVMAQDIQYDIKLDPYQSTIVELHPVQASIDFEYYVEGGQVTFCQIDNKNKCIEEKVIGSHGKQLIDSSNSRQVRIRISNFLKPPTQKNEEAEQPEGEYQDDMTKRKSKQPKITTLINPVKVTLIYHATGSDHCDQKRLNKVYSQSVQANKCFKFHLPLSTDIQIMASHSQIGLAYQTYILCSKKVKPAEINDRYVIKANVIKQACQKSLNDMNLVMVIGSKNINFPAGLKIDYSVQYNNDTVTLADGVAYIARGQSTPEIPQRTFFYQILDQSKDINIVLFNRKGTQRFYANLFVQSERYFGVVTEGKAKFNSKNSDYYTNPYIKITPNDIKLAECGKSCVLVVSIYSSQKTGTDIEYALEITQNHIQLRQDELRKDFLPKFSFNFYQYEARKQQGSIYFTVSDNNRKCVRSILGKNPFPTGSNYIVKQNQGSILYPKSQKGIYYFSVQATQDCPYTVSVSERDQVITRMQYSQFFDIRLEEGEKKWFYTRHISNSSLKIIFVKQFGEIQLYANQTDLSKQVLRKIRDKQLDVSQLSFKTSYKNTISINSNSKDFCSNCYYIFCVQATKLTQGALFLGSDNSKLTIGDKRIVFDQLTSLNSSTGASLYKVSAGVLEVKVHSGKVKLQMAYSSQKFSKQFNQDKKVYRQTYNFTRQEGKYQPMEVMVTPLQVPALYSFQLAPEVDPSSYLRTLNPGQHTYIFLQNSQKQCLLGTITQKEEEVFITTDSAETYLLNDLKLQVKINEKQTTQFKKEVVGNILSLRFTSESKLVTQFRKFNICISTQSRNDTLTLMAFQSNNVNLIHSDTQVLLRNQAKYVLYPRSDVIVDLFQCEGTAQIYYGADLQKIRQQTSHKLDVIGIPGQSHAIRISQASTLYLDITAKMATVLWMPLIESQERGVGYFKYSIGKLEYKSRFNNIQFLIGGVYQAKKTKTQVRRIVYTLYVSNSKQALQQAVMCQKSQSQKFVKVSVTTQQYGQNPDYVVSLSLDKKRITDQFSNNETLYFNVVADMTLAPPSELKEGYHQHYRFVYFEQVVPSQVFRQNKIESMQLTLLIILAVVSVIGFVLIACVFIRCIVPAIGKLKNRVLVQQENDNKDSSIPVPQSSQRNKNDIPTGTDEQLK